MTDNNNNLTCWNCAPASTVLSTCFTCSSSARLRVGEQVTPGEKFCNDFVRHILTEEASEKYHYQEWVICFVSVE